MGIKSNNRAESYFNFFGASGTDAASVYVEAAYTEATGGIISDYTDPGPGKHYRAHIFTAAGTFDVTQVGSNADLDFLVIAGGGSGGGNIGGGGGAGGLRTSMPEGPG